MSRILIIDDDALLRDLLTKMLIRNGHQVVTAEDGRQGLLKFQQFNPDLILTDIIMPKKDGIEVIIKLLQFCPTLPIIAMSGGGRIVTADNLNAALMLGAKGILYKPFTYKQLQTVIAEVFS